MLEPHQITDAAAEAASFLAAELGDIPKTAVVLGTGWTGSTTRTP